jgi:hypothetical protein
MEAPKVFISYSHDSPEHAGRVLGLSDRLRQDGIDCHIDQYEVSPPEGWPRWMVNKVEWADFVLVVCTETYQQRFKGKAPAGQGKGVKWEGSILTQELYDAEAQNTRFIPVVFSSPDTDHIPIVLRGQTPYNVSNDKGYEELYRHLTNQPRTVRPTLGKLKPMPPKNKKSNDKHESDVGIIKKILLPLCIVSIICVLILFNLRDCGNKKCPIRVTDKILFKEKLKSADNFFQVNHFYQSAKEYEKASNLLIPTQDVDLTIINEASKKIESDPQQSCDNYKKFFKHCDLKLN